MSSAEMTKTAIQERYDQFAAGELINRRTYEKVSRAKAYFRSEKLDRALGMACFHAGSHLLEIGCSVGQFSIPLSQKGYRVMGVDLSENSVAVARKRAFALGLSHAEFQSADAENLSLFPPDSFDGVLSFSTLRYLSNLPRALSEIYRVLKPGSRAVVDFPNRLCPWFYLKQWLGSETHPNDHWYTAGALARMFRKTGFREISAQTILFTPTVAPDWLFPLFRRIDRIGERIPAIRNLAGIILIKGEKP